MNLKTLSRTNAFSSAPVDLTQNAVAPRSQGLLSFGKLRIAQLAALLWACCLVASAAAQPSVSFYDGNFTKNWKSQTVNYALGGTYTSAASTLGCMRTIMSTGNGFQSALQVIYTNRSFIWICGTQGSINRIDYSESLKSVGGQIASGLALVQTKGGVSRVYVARYLADTLGIFEPHTDAGLTAANFGEIRTNLYGVDMTQNPDFSTAGGVIQFGFLQGESANQTVVKQAWIDDFFVRIWPN